MPDLKMPSRDRQVHPPIEVELSLLNTERLAAYLAADGPVQYVVRHICNGFGQLRCVDYFFHLQRLLFAIAPAESLFESFVAAERHVIHCCRLVVREVRE